MSKRMETYGRYRRNEEEILSMIGSSLGTGQSKRQIANLLYKLEGVPKENTLSMFDRAVRKSLERKR